MFNIILSRSAQPRKAVAVYTKPAACRGWRGRISRFASLHLHHKVLFRCVVTASLTTANLTQEARTAVAGTAAGAIQQHVLDERETAQCRHSAGAIRAAERQQCGGAKATDEIHSV